MEVLEKGLVGEGLFEWWCTDQKRKWCEWEVLWRCDESMCKWVVGWLVVKERVGEWSDEKRGLVREP